MTISLGENFKIDCESYEIDKIEITDEVAIVHFKKSYGKEYACIPIATHNPFEEEV